MTENKAYENDVKNGVSSQTQAMEMDTDKDQVTLAIGEGGKWQSQQFFLISLVGIFAAFHMMVISLYTPDADHWCRPPESLRHLSLDEWRDMGLPREKEESDKWSSCKMYINETEAQANETVECMYGWEFDRSQFKHTLENQFDLVCSREALAKTGAASFNLGKLAGVVILGQVSDRFGRKNTLLLSSSLIFLFGIITTFMPLLWLFFVTRFFVAMGCSGAFTTGFVMIMEMVDGKWRTFFGIGMEFFWCFGYILLAGIAYAIPDWQHLQLAISIPAVILAIHYWLVPESMRWLLSQDRVEEAEETAKKAAERNKRTNSVRLQSTWHKKEEEQKKRSTVLDLFRTPVLRGRTLNFCFNWFVNSFVYYGLSLGTSSLGGNKYITFFISGAVEVPAYILSLWVLMAHGRRIPHCASMVIGGASCLMTAAFEKGAYMYDWPIVLFAMIGKFCISASFAIVYVYSAEIYPTVVRNSGMGISSMFARIGSILAPYVDLLRHLHPAVPLAIFGCFSLAAGFLILLMPETNNKPLSETIDQAEKFGRKQKT